MDQGFAPPRFKIPTRSVATGRMRAMGKGPTIAQQVGSLEHQVLEPRVKPTVEDRTISLMGRARALGYSMFTFGWIRLPFMPMPLPIPAMAAGLLARFGLKSAPLVTDMMFRAPIEGLHTTPLRQWHQAPANMLKQAAEHAGAFEGGLKQTLEEATKQAAEKGATLDPKLVRSLTNNMEMAHKWQKALRHPAAILAKGGRNIGKAANAGFFTPIRQAVKSGLARFSQTGVGTHVEEGLKGFAGNRLQVAQLRQTKALDAAKNAFTTQVPGFFGTIKNFILKRSPGTLPAVPDALKTAKSYVDAGNLTKGAEAVRSVLMDKNSGQEALRQGYSVLTKLGKAAAADGRVHTLQHMQSGGFTGLVKSAASRLGNAKLFYVIIGLAMTAGIVGSWLSNRKEGRAADKALASLATDLGTKDHPLYRSALSAGRGQKLARGVGTVTGAAGEIMMLNGAGIAPVVALQALPAVAGMALFKDNEPLNAHMILKAADEKKIQLSAEQKAPSIATLLAPTADMIEAAHNPDPKRRPVTEGNHLVQAMALSMAQEGLGVKDIMGYAASQPKLLSYAQKTAQRLEAEKAAAAAPVAEAKVERPMPTTGVAPTIAAAAGTAQGRVVETQIAKA